MAESSITETMHGALLEALRHREQEIFSYLAILVPTLGGFLWLLLHRSAAVGSGDLVLFAGTLGTLLLFFLGVGYSLTLGYNFRYVTFQLAKIEHHLEVEKVILQGWPRSPQAFKTRYRLWGFTYCAPPEMIKIFWIAFLIGMLWVIVVYSSLGAGAPYREIVISVGAVFFLCGLFGPFWFGRKLERLFSKEGDDWKESSGTPSEQQPPMVPVGVGNAPAQRRFIQRHERFLAEYPKLFELYSKMFIRTVEPPDENERQALLHLPDDAPAVIAFEDRSTADYLIFYLGRMAADDFGEILELSGNGAGFAAFIHLRSMYERLITAMYLAKKPSEARVFAENSPIYKFNYLSRLRELIPEEKPDTPEKAKWPEFKTCKYTTEAIVSDGIDKGELRKVCTEPTCPVHHPKKQTPKADATFKAEQEKRRREEALANAIGIRVLQSIVAAVPVRLMKRDLLFVVEHLLPLLDEKRLDMVARNRNIKAREGESAGRLLTASSRKADEGTVGKLIIEAVILLSARSQADAGKTLRAAAHVYGVDPDAVAMKVKEEFAAKEKAKKTLKPEPKPAKTAKRAA